MGAPRLKRNVAGAAGSVAILCLFWAPAFGQEDEGGRLFTFGISTSLNGSDNADLDVDSEGSTLQSETTLSFGFESITRTQSLRFSLADTLRFGDGADVETGFRGPNASLGYERLGSNAQLELSARVSTREVDSDLTDDDLGVSDALIVDSGTLTVSNLGFNLEVGQQAPFGAEFALSENRRTFSDTTDPDLEDRRTRRGSVTLIFRHDRATETRWSYEFIDFDEEDAEGTERDTHSLDFGFERELDPSRRITASIGWTEVEEVQTAIPLTLPDESGLTLFLGYERGLPDGSLTTELERSVDDAGGRTDLSANRIFQIPGGALDITLGATMQDDEGIFPIGRIDYSRALPAQNFEVALSSTITVNSDSEVLRDTVLGAGYGLQINERGSLGLSLDFAMTNPVDGSTGSDRTRASATASYRRTLTQDWAMSAGYTHRISRDEDEDTARSNTLFVTLGRDFTWRP